MKRSVSVGLLAVFGATAALAAPVVDLTTAGYYTYGNANSYSLPLNGIDVQSSPGQIKDFLVVYTGASGVPVRTNVAGFDDAYLAPSGTAPYASIAGAVNMTDPGNKSGIANNDANTWDANLLAMKGYLGGGTTLFMFNNNDDNSDQNLAVWAKLWVTDGAGAVYGRHLYLSNEGAAYVGGGVPLGDATLYDPGDITTPTTGFAATDYVLAGGEVLGVNHNLGADHAAYAVDVPLLNAWLDTLFAQSDAALSQYTLHLDLRLGCIDAAGWSGTCDNIKIDDGYEQLFIMANERVPEPTALALCGLALALLGLGRHRSSRRN